MKKWIVILFFVVIVSMPLIPVIAEKISTPTAQGYSASRMGAGK